MELVALPEMPTRFTEIERFAADLGLHAVDAGAIRRSHAGRWIALTAGPPADRRIKIRQPDGQSIALEGAHFPVDGQGPPTLAYLAVHPTQERAAVLVSRKFDHSVWELDLAGLGVRRLASSRTPHGLAWLDDTHLAIAQMGGTRVLAVGDTHVREHDTCKFLGRLFTVAQGRVLVVSTATSKGAPVLHVLPVYGGHIAETKAKVTMSPEDDVRDVFDHEGRVVVCTATAAWELAGADEEVERLDPRAALTAIHGAMQKTFKKSGFGIVAVEGSTPTVQPDPSVPITRPPSVYDEISHARRLGDGRIAAIAGHELLVLDEGADAPTLRTTIPGAYAVIPHPGVPSLLWILTTTEDRYRKAPAIPRTVLRAVDLAAAHVRDFNSWDLPAYAPTGGFVDGRLLLQAEGRTWELAGMDRCLERHRTYFE